MSQAGVLLDRDGTIIVDSGYVGSVDRVEFIDGAIEAIGSLNRAGIPVAVVTNQAGVARGHYAIEDVEQVHKHMIAELANRGAHVDLWLFCPYHPDGSVASFARASWDRKPAPGMALAAADALDLDLAASWVIGDRDSDIGLARAVGATPLFLGPGGTTEPDVPRFPDLAAAVAHVLSVRRENGARQHIEPPKFPARQFDRADSYGGAYVAELSRAFDTVDLSRVHAAAELLTDAYLRDGAVFACGNGGSASIANHLQCDHVKGVRNGTGLLARVQSLSTNMELFSAIANDIGYEHVFSYQLESIARPGDVLIAVSSSGRSPNIVRAVDWANANGMRTIALTGFEGGDTRARANVPIHVDSRNYGIIEDAHQALMHLLAQYVRQSQLSADAVAGQVF
ncbi:MAG TPA: HAD-IIIA family hydrolase [Actinophytocola sp.]|jgi:D-sedoheptulose 7-phosphate isomerase/D-glycero-D-manno-heptose 1,7-bisphosphate phosphatase|uniref:HAD-IIIA family hydrolase n=1 Tax=Actinophytocola sp. TaxID=1872138 RepID=UPI002F94DB0A